MTEQAPASSPDPQRPQPADGFCGRADHRDQCYLRAWCSVTLIFLSVLTTGLGWYQRLAKYAGAGTLVPITGFANAMSSPAIEFKSEGMVLGLAAKLFVIAGPVIVYGTVASVLYGLVLVIFGMG